MTHLDRTSIDHARAAAQHAAYVALLERLGCSVVTLPASPGLPDCVFVEDTAVVTEDFAVITRPGSPAREPEVHATAEALVALDRRLDSIEAPGTLDGGDVLRVGRRLFVGRGGRTNDQGIAQLARIASRHGFEVLPVQMRDCLHLKTGVTAVDDRTLLINRAWIDTKELTRLAWLDVAPSEPFGANALRLGDTLVYPQSHPTTAALLRARGYDVATVDISELAKAEAGVTCCSVIVPTPPRR